MSPRMIRKSAAHKCRQRMLTAFFLLSMVFFCDFLKPAHALPELQKDSVILDDEVEAYFQKWFEEVFNAASRQKSVVKPRVYLISNQAVNAGAAPGGQFVIFTGLFKLCETAEEFMGVLAHEVAHVRGNHMVQMVMAEEKSMLTAAIAFALGGVAAIAGGDVAPLIAGMSGGANVYLRSGMKHSQDLEIAADAEAIKTLGRLGIPLTGLRDFLVRIKKMEGAPDIDRYFMDHPPTEDRIAALEAEIKSHPQPTWARSAEYNGIYQRLKAKILGFTLKPSDIFKKYNGDTLNDAFARAIAYGRNAQVGKAHQEIDKMIAAHPNDAFALELKSQLYLDEKKGDQAIQSLEKAAALKPQATYLRFSLAHLLVETGKDLPKAEGILRTITQKGEMGDFAWLLLGKAYALQGKQDLALWANAEHDARSGDTKIATAKLKRAKGMAKNAETRRKIDDTEASIKAEGPQADKRRKR